MPSEEWWGEGVRFACVECGRCCRGEPGAIFFTAREGERVREVLGLTEDEFQRAYVTLRWGRPSFVERRNGDCVFLAADGARCRIYPLRPAQCALFPFWPSIMASKDEWNYHAERCLGMNAGRLYSPNEIHCLLNQTPFEDL
ncbi:MAG: YkgJ family cysteine cluster protein [Synergistaceae bacterium]|jgi:Fe-S-cluster containining protein|nr:YkgJ family cysteine cluster protein [Synergistaceae bacterium]